MTDHAPDQPTTQPADNTPPATPTIRISPRTGRPMQKQLCKAPEDLKRRARIVAREIINGASSYMAAKTAGYSDSYAKYCQPEILQNPTIKATFASIMDKAGLTDDSLAQDINRLRKFSKAHIIKGLDKDEVVQVEDGQVQLGAVKLAVQLKGHLIERREDASTTNVNVLSISTEELLEIAARGRAIDVAPEDEPHRQPTGNPAPVARSEAE